MKRVLQWLVESVVGVPQQKDDYGLPLGHKDLGCHYVRESVPEECDRLLLLDHQEHEEILDFLQQQRDPYCIPFIARAIELKPMLRYLAHDDYGAYYKRCLWVLQDVGTKEAVDSIEAFTHSPIPALRDQAAYRLRRIAEQAP